jgi:NitT/TauT family transport system substrate-binding protein
MVGIVGILVVRELPAVVTANRDEPIHFVAGGPFTSMIRSHFSRARFTAVTAGYVALTVAGAAAQARATLRVGTLPIDNGAEIFYGIERGFFAKAGLDIDLHLLNNGGAIVAAVASGAVDVGFSNLFSVVTAFSKGIPIQVIAPAALYDSGSPAQALLVRRDGPIHDAKDLNGKTIAVDGLKGITHITVTAWMDQSGGDSSSVHWIEMPDSLMAQAVIDRRIDGASAALSDNPGVRSTTSPLRILAFPYESVAKRFLASGWFAAKQWATAHPDLVRRFAEAIVVSGKWANANKTASGAILAKYTKLTPERVALIAGNRAIYDEVPLRAAAIEPVIAFSAKHGVITNAFPAQALVAVP